MLGSHVPDQDISDTQIVCKFNEMFPVIGQFRDQIGQLGPIGSLASVPARSVAASSSRCSASVVVLFHDFVRCDPYLLGEGWRQSGGIQSCRLYTAFCGLAPPPSTLHRT